MKCITQVAQEFCQIVQKNVRDAFDADLLCWARAILLYTKETQLNSTQLQTALGNVGDDPGMQHALSLATLPNCVHVIFVQMWTALILPPEGLNIVVHSFLIYTALTVRAWCEN